MKTLRILLLILALICTANGQGVLLNAGDAWAYHFANLDYVSTQSGSPAPYGATFSFTYTVTAYPPNLIYEVFEGVPSDGSLGSGTQPIGGMGILLPTSAWQDLEGSARLTVTDGSFRVDSLTFTVWRPNASDPLSFDTFRTTFSPVPEPASAALLLSGCIVFWYAQKQRAYPQTGATLLR